MDLNYGAKQAVTGAAEAVGGENLSPSGRLCQGNWLG